MNVLRNSKMEKIGVGSIVKSNEEFNEKCKTEEQDSGYYVPFKGVKVKYISAGYVTVFANGYDRTHDVKWVELDK
ncbi:hypothetical protein [Paenibacillus contaminans]|uniref:Uncharacterized protein n=1 Tax=Paenibacillus contaminans TaxID=450362 RepID=A0A329LSH8_9BACL|nr:hypothetical protein [Paenibacillus contaminans]RAV10140.1 hypothetical protein DQG23_38500 [Paenibacillus contaminans]